MSLEEMNRQYILYKQLIEQYKKDKKTLETESKDALKDKDLAEKELDAATAAKDKKQQALAESKVNAAISKISFIDHRLETIENGLKSAQDIVKGFLNELRNDPDIMKECNEAFEKNRERQIKKWEKRKEDRIKDKENWEMLKSAIEKNPEASIEVDKITVNTFEITKLEQEIKDIDDQIEKLDPNDATNSSKIADLNDKKINKENERDTKEKEKKDSRSKLKGMFNGKYSEYIDQLEQRSDLDNNIKKYDRLIKRADRKIVEHTARQNQFTEPEHVKPTRTKPLAVKQTSGGKKSALDKIKGFFKKIFKRNTPPELPTPVAPPTPKIENKSNNFLQYIIVKDVLGVENKTYQGKDEKNGKQINEGQTMKPKSDDELIQ